MSIDTIAKGIVGAELIGCLALSVWAYGKSLYLKGRIDAANDIKKEMEKIRDEVMSKSKKQTHNRRTQTSSSIFVFF